jgi:hypothetical protein
MRVFTARTSGFVDQGFVKRCARPVRCPLNNLTAPERSKAHVVTHVAAYVDGTER